MLPKSRRALTIQEIAALARSSLHGNCLSGPGHAGAWQGSGGALLWARAHCREGTLGFGRLKMFLGVRGGTQEKGM